MRHLFVLPRAVTSFPLVRDFFEIKDNGLDGLLPPSPVLGQSSNAFAVAAAIANARFAGESEGMQLAYPGIRERSPEGVASPLTQVRRPSRPAGLDADNSPRNLSVRAQLATQRSTPDLRRLAAAHQDGFNGYNQIPQRSSSLARPAYPAHLDFKFPRAAPAIPSTCVPVASPDAENTDVNQYRSYPPRSPSSSFHLASALNNALRSSSTGARCNTAGSTSACSDTASLRTESTARPGSRNRTPSGSTVLYSAGNTASSSRAVSPASPIYHRDAPTPEGCFGEPHVDTTGNVDGVRPLATTNMPAVTPRKTSRGGLGGMKHFRSLQDLRHALQPHPSLPPEMPSGSFLEAYDAPTAYQTPSLRRPSLKPLHDDSAMSSATSTAHPSPIGSLRSSPALAESKSFKNLFKRAAGSSSAESDTASPPLPHSTPKFKRPSLSNLRKHYTSASKSSAPPVSASTAATPSPAYLSLRRAPNAVGLGSPISPTSEHTHNSSISSIASLEYSSSASNGFTTPISATSSRSGSFAGLGFDFSSSTSVGSNPSVDSLVSTSSPMMSCPAAFEGFYRDASVSAPAPLLEDVPQSLAMTYGAHTTSLQKSAYTRPALPQLYTGLSLAAVDKDLPISPTPSVIMNECDPISPLSSPISENHGRRRSLRVHRRRTSSLHTPVLETILASPRLDSNDVETTPLQPTPRTLKAARSLHKAIQESSTITLKIMTDSSNFLLKIPRDLSLLGARDRIAEKCISSGIDLPEGDWYIAVACSAGAGSSKTATKIFEAKSLKELVQIEDDDDWKTTIGLAPAKLTLRVV